jgi:hypothetical protein
MGTMAKRPLGWWTEDRIISALQAWARWHDGRPPRQEDWRRVGVDHPSSTTVKNRFGSWNVAIGRAGLVPLPRGGQSAVACLRDRVAVLEWRLAALERQLGAARDSRR